MKKLLIAGAALGMLTTSFAANAGSIRVYNNDSKTHTVKLKCSGSSKSIDIKGSTTSTYTFHSTSSSCDIVGGSVSFPTKKMENGQKWKIKDGKAKKN